MEKKFSAMHHPVKGNFMKMARKVHFAAASVLTLCLAACSSKPAQMDYTAFKEAKPRSILVLPPINHTSSVNAPYGLLSQMTHPLAEGGYYVVPVAMELETFHQNGVPMPDEMAQIPAEKLRAILEQMQYFTRQLLPMVRIMGFWIA